MIDTYASQGDVSAAETPAGETHSGYIIKLYAQAWAYWQSATDTERLALTDDQLDEQFWCTDPAGIPRLKSDRSKITLPDNGLLAILEEIWQDA